jgi:hypothetical protein
VGALIELDAWASQASLQSESTCTDSTALRTRHPRSISSVHYRRAILPSASGQQARFDQRHPPPLHALDAWPKEPGLGNAALDIRTFDLGAIRGVPLCFTDGAACPTGAVF